MYKRTEGGCIICCFFLVASLGDYENGWRMRGLGKSGYEALVAAKKFYLELWWGIFSLSFFFLCLGFFWTLSMGYQHLGLEQPVLRFMFLYRYHAATVPFFYGFSVVGGGGACEEGQGHFLCIMCGI